ncbi:hypothetical protein RchiOBHm_Chr4g0418221 [Rosa chinensis]|uniref:Uncharacterized protein n=1 Tax=Rosa chinensis TaxID=74649 RepID=A0A2P6QXC8_ROSCH|nr:hypothetical protein RchiOBHm_Chr4g0418221 [Rosa chinensis]
MFGLRCVEVVGKRAEKKKEVQKSSHGRKAERIEEKRVKGSWKLIYDAEVCRGWL